MVIKSLWEKAKHPFPIPSRSMLATWLFLETRRQWEEYQLLAMSGMA